MKKIIIYSVIFILLILLIGLFILFKEPKIMNSKERCESEGGIWGKFGLSQIEECNMLTNDGMSICNNSNECEVGICIVDLTVEEERGVVEGNPITTNGYCPKYNIITGCYPIVEGGIVDSILCID